MILPAVALADCCAILLASLSSAFRCFSAACKVTLQTSENIILNVSRHVCSFTLAMCRIFFAAASCYRQTICS